MADNWIQGAINPAHKGAFTRKANAAGKSVGEYAQEEQHAPGITGRQARLAMTLRKFADGGVVQPAKDDPIDAQIEARRLLARQGYRGVSPAGLPPSFASQPLVGSDITVDVGGHKFSVPADKSYDVAPEQWKPSDASAMGIRPGVLAQLIDKARMAAEESSYIPSSYRQQTPKHYADGGVVTPQQPPQQMPAWQRIWQALMGREALRRASGEQPQAPPPQNTDYSIVRKAAEEAGKRNDEEQRLKNAQPKPFCDGGMVRPYR